MTYCVSLQERVDSAAGKAACSGNLPSVDYAPTWDVDDVIELDVCQGRLIAAESWSRDTFTIVYGCPDVT